MNTGNAPSWRQITVIAVIFILLSGFMLMYFYYYIPNNRQRTNQYGLRILHLIANNTVDKEQALEKLYLNNLRNPRLHKDSDSSSISFGNVVDSLRPLILSDTSFPYVPQVKQDRFEVTLGHDTLLLSTPYKRPGTELTDNVRLAIPVSMLIKPLTSYRHEYFESFALIDVVDHKNGRLIFEDGGHGSLNSQISIDTFFSAHRSDMFASILPLEIGAEKYMLFAQPLNLKGTPLLLCGIMKWDDYQRHINSIPLPFILSVAIVFLLVLVYLPILKFQLIGKMDHVGLADILYIVLSLFVGMTVITLIVIQVVLLMSGQLRAYAELDKLNQDVSGRFYTEVTDIAKELRGYDSTLKAQLATLHNKERLQRPRDFKDADVVYVLPKADMSLPGDTLTMPIGDGVEDYHHFDRVTWTARSGQQLYKAQRGNPVVFIRDNTREYFRRFMDLQTYPLPDDLDSTFAIEPLYSQSTGDFRVNYAMRSYADSMFLITLNTQLYSLTHTNFPVGYGYFLMDEKGEVLAHVDADRNLREFFPDETDRPDYVYEAIRSRQDFFFTANYYGKERSVLIRPLKKLPFFLVTYCANDPRYASGTRILLFALTYSLGVYLLLVVFLWLCFFNSIRRSGSLPALEYFRWMIPKRRLSHYYKYAGFVALVIGLLLALLAISIGRIPYDEHVIFAFGFLMPLVVVVVLHAGYLQRYYCLPLRRYHWGPTMALALLMLVVFFIFGMDSCMYAWVYVVVNIFILGMLVWMLSHADERQREMPVEGGSRYVHNYAWLVVCLGISLAVVPSVIFSVYAYDHENAQYIKMQQLHLADQLRNKRVETWHVVFPEWPLDKGASQARQNVFEDALYKKSVYTLYDQQLYPLHDNDEKQLLAAHYDSTARKEDKSCYYFEVTNQLSAYHDMLNYPALRAAAADGVWEWKQRGDSMLMWYAYQPGAQQPGQQRRGLIIVSHYPRLYYLLSNPLVDAFLLLVTLLVAMGKYFRVKRLSRRLFLLSLLRTRDHLPLRVWQFSEEESLHQEQVQLALRAEAENRWSYKEAWREFSDNEKITLAQMAVSGLTNMENDQALHNLLQHGWLVRDQDMLRLRDPSFAYFVKTRLDTPEMRKLRRASQRNSSWHAFKLPMQLLLLFVAGFIFFTQEGLFQRTVALIGSIGSMMLVFRNVLGAAGKGSGAPAAKDGDK